MNSLAWYCLVKLRKLSKLMLRYALMAEFQNENLDVIFYVWK